MHLPRDKSSWAAGVLAIVLGAAVAFPAPAVLAIDNPLDKIFGTKKYEDPPPKKKATKSTKKKSTTAEATKASKPGSTTKKKTGDGDVDGNAKAPGKRVSTMTTKKSKANSTAKKKAETVNDEEAKQPASKLKASAGPAPTPVPEVAPPLTAATGQTSSIGSDELKEFAAQPERVKQLIESCLELTRRNLTYTYGSADPAKGGMDCSGFIYYTLRAAGFSDAPRQANEQYVWVRKNSVFRAVLSRKSDTFEINELQPGDLMFWTGTYDIDRDPPVTHTMIYLGTVKKTGQRLMVGSSDGRTYGGVKQNGVSVFDFRVATNGQKADAPILNRTPSFAGYGSIPSLR